MFSKSQQAESVIFISKLSAVCITYCIREYITVLSQIGKAIISCNPTQLGKQLKVLGTNIHNAAQQRFNPPWKEPMFKKAHKFSYSLFNSSNNNIFTEL
jgi:hypothetical protein